MNKQSQIESTAGFMPSIQQQITLMTISIIAGLSLCSCQRQPSPSAIHLAVPKVTQGNTYDCGLAAIEALYGYHQIPFSAQIHQHYQDRAQQENGLSGKILQQILEGDGFQVFIFTGTADHQKPHGLAYHLQKGRPCVVLLGNRKHQKHYLVAKGFEQDLQHWYFMDPATGDKHLTDKQFATLWSQAEHFLLLAMPNKNR